VRVERTRTREQGKPASVEHEIWKFHYSHCAQQEQITFCEHGRKTGRNTSIRSPLPAITCQAGAVEATIAVDAVVAAVVEDAVADEVITTPVIVVPRRKDYAAPLETMFSIME